MSRLWDAYARLEQRTIAAALLLHGTPTKPLLRYMQRSCPGWRYRDGGMLTIERGALHLRWVGDVTPDFKSYDTPFQRAASKSSGWYTNCEGWSTKSGDGLVWGTVYQLPGRDRCTIYVAGYEIGAQDCVTLDTNTLFIDPPSQVDDYGDARRQAARHADRMAEDLSETLRQEDYEDQEKQRELEEEE